jgi:hypothetical protein
MFALIVSALALTQGVVTERRQRREAAPFAIVPTLPFAVQSTLLATVGIVLLGRTQDWARLPWWGYVLAALCHVAAGIGLVLLVGRSRKLQ